MITGKDSGDAASSERFPIRRIWLKDYLDDFFFDQEYEHLIGAARNAKNGQVVDLTLGRKVADVDLPGLPHLGSGITWNYQGRPVLATPNLKEGAVSVIDMQDLANDQAYRHQGPGIFYAQPREYALCLGRRVFRPA